MDGVHDLGGMDGFGPVEREAAASPFHDDWEGVAFATVLVTMAQGHYTMDAFRHAIERMDPAWYLSAGYYERWLAAAERLLVEEDVVDAATLAARAGSFAAGEATVPERTDPDLAAFLRSVIDSGGDSERDPVEPAFDEGDAVRVKNLHPEGHTRCPEYVRRARGTVAAHRGTHVFPDAHAHGEGEQPEPLYAVRFDGTELWGEDADPDTSVTVDLWEPYLESA
ncbi:MAG: nitrile hydratase subunit beta [Haloarculaceae archaeon]